MVSVQGPTRQGSSSARGTLRSVMSVQEPTGWGSSGARGGTLRRGECVRAYRGQQRRERRNLRRGECARVYGDSSSCEST